MKPSLPLSGVLVRALACSVCCLVACSPPPAEEVLVTAGIDSAEARLGGGCRAVDDLEPLLTFLEGIPADWQAFWKEPPSSPFLLTLAREGTPRLRVGVTDGTMIVERAGGSPRFRAVSEAEASRLVQLVGGVPLGDQLDSCRMSDTPLTQ